ncbi:hypothetical protein [Cytobacillus firmus]|uniref:Surface layer (S-layer) glycoprotein n=1 Tax=Cytobacillus firmus DS1 TaxID=1307436 RepID=W7KXA2_CYTFI|nr:hypothetical protein [Cytobacillus firmus]EWG12040.1 surface layer (S-layer) glycoprotein [Cytobacillus firmus DS1]
MAKKKAIKLAAASAVAASAFVAAAPAQTDAASNVAVEVSKAVTQMKKAYHTYSDVTATGEFADITAVYKEYNKAKDMYAAAKELVNKAGGANKEAHLATLDATYNDHIKKRVIPYIDAYNYAQDLKEATAELNGAVKAGELDGAEDAYHAVSKELRTRTAIFYRVYGKSTRDLFLNDFKAKADSSVVEVREEVTIKMAYDLAETALEEGNLEEAQKQFDKVAEYLENLDTDSEFGKALSAKVEAAQEKFEELSVPAVESVSAINAKQVEVKFNKAVDKTTVIGTDDTAKDGVFSFTSLNGETVAVAGDDAAATLSEDGKTLTLTAVTTFSGKYAVQVKGVKTIDAKEIGTFEQIVEFKDQVAPQLVAASASAKTATNKVTLRFNEPVQASGAIVSVNGVSASVAPGANLNELVVTASSDLQAGSTANISIINVKDFANNFITPNPLQTTVTVAADTVAPNVVSAEVTGEKKVTVKFDKAVNVDSFANNVRLLSVNGEAVTTFSAEAGANDKEVVLTTVADLAYGPNGTFTGNLLIGTGVLDKAGNNLAATFSKSVTFTKDTVAPVVTGVSYADGKVTVNFSENVVESTVSATIINEATGEVVSSLNGDDSVTDGTKLVFTKSLAEGNYTIRLAANSVADTSLAGNKNAFDVRSFTVVATPVTPTTDTTKPVIANDSIATSVSGTEQLVTYTVTDEKGVDLTSVRNVSNYTFDGKALPTGTYITTALNGDAEGKDVDVTIHIPSKSISETKTANFLVNNVKDKAGNLIVAPAVKEITLTDGVSPLLSSAVVSAGDNSTLVLGFSEAVAGVAADDFVITLNGKDVSASVSLEEVSSGTDKGKYYVTVATLVDTNSTLEDLSDDKLYVEVDEVDGLTEGDLVLKTGTVTAGNVDFKASYVTGLKVAVADDATIADGENNPVVAGTTITLK